MQNPAPLRFSVLCLVAAGSLLTGWGCAPRQPMVSFLSPPGADPCDLGRVERLAVCRVGALSAEAEPWLDLATHRLTEAVGEALAERAGRDGPRRITPVPDAGKTAWGPCDAHSAGAIAARTGAEAVLCAAMALTRSAAGPTQPGGAEHGRFIRAELYLTVWNTRQAGTTLSMAIAEEADLAPPEDVSVR